jgi:L-seryl-tRNA(Ser) seleniumtransferase
LATGYDLGSLAQTVCLRVAALTDPSLKPVINAGGVILHTNLGRSVLCEQAQDVVAEVMEGYSTLEYDLSAQRRGSRHDHIEHLLCAVTGAEAAMAVNNNAAAVLLVLAALARGGEVPVSRGELVEIGGSFRIPDIMEQSGATMVEVGTTNRTALKDYERALSERTALIAKIHPSNYLISGFTRSAGVEELAALARKHDLPLYFDQGTGLLMKLEALLPPGFVGSWDEASVGELLEAGCDLVSFSGDKLLGGPQAGLVVGRREYIERLKAHPLARALRLDKLSLAALAATLRLYLKPEIAKEQIPSLRMLSRSVDDLMPLAEFLLASLNEKLAAKGGADVARAEISVQPARVGGGTLPALELPSPTVCVLPLKGSVDGLASWLIGRSESLPIIARVFEGQLILDVRTLSGEAEAEIIAETIAHYFIS